MGKSIGVLTKDVKELLRNLVIIKTCDDANKILNLPTEKFNKLKGISDKTVKERLVRILEIFSDAEKARPSVRPTAS